MSLKRLSKNPFGGVAALSVFIAIAASPTKAHASAWALPLSVSGGVGTMKNSDLGLKSRTMSALSFEALPSYRLGSWLLGLHFDSRWQGQLTGLDEAGGTNLKGHGSLAGLGARLDFSERGFVQLSVDLAGQYDFAKHTDANEDDRLNGPLGVRVKAGSALFQRWPNLSLDLDLHHLTFKRFLISGAESIASTQQLMASVGLTYQFAKAPSAAAPPAATPAPAPEPKPAEEPPPAAEGLVLNLSGNSFDFRSADLRPEAKAHLEKAAEGLVAAMAKNPALRVRIEGHTDSVGNLQRNERLSRNRAMSVKNFLVERGVDEARIETAGFGPSRPIADNKTEEGRARNRRVDISLDEVKGQEP